MSTTTDLPGSVGAEYAQADEHRPLAGYAAVSLAYSGAEQRS